MSLQRDLTIERKNLTQLEGSDWGHSSSESYIERGCHELRYKPLADMEVEDLRLLIGQNIGLRYLMPIAFDALRQNPLAEGMHYAIERQLAHAESNKVREAYTHAAQYLDERKRMMQAWAD